MCGRYTIYAPAETLERRFHAALPSTTLQPTYNAAPSQDLPVITNDRAATITLGTWGFVPEWAKGKNVKAVINARAESIADKPFFRQAFRRKRCLVLANGFYEWKKVGARKVPHYISLSSGEPFAFAGLWSTRENDDGKELVTYAIITTVANDLMRQVHDRMPVLLGEADEPCWLDSALPQADALAILVPYAASAMAMHPVSTRVNTPTYNVPEAMAAVSS